MYIVKNRQGQYKYKMGINFYRLPANTDYTLCLKILNTDYNLWDNTQISVDKGTSTGLSIGNVGIRKLSHRYTDLKRQTKVMYYHRIIVNFRKLSSGNKYFLHILVDIKNRGYDIARYPLVFKGVYMIAYGIVGTVSNIDPDKVYDYHTAFDIYSTYVTYNVPINLNQKEILNIRLDKSSDDNVATVGMVKELIPHTTNYFYSHYFEEYYDFSDANIYGINTSSSGVIINSLKRNITIPNKDLRSVKNKGLDVVNYNVTFSLQSSSKYTFCIVFYHWNNRSFTLTKYLPTNNNILLKLNFNKRNNSVNLTVGKTTQSSFLTNSFNGKKIVIWLAAKFDSNVAKVKISNVSSTITIPAIHYNVNQRWKFTTEGGVLNKIMYSKNFDDFDSEQFHKVMIQEKLNGSYIL